VLILSLSNGEAPDRRSALLPVLMFSIPSVLFICCWRMIPKTTPPVNEFATLEWVELFNRRRLLGPIGYVPPAEFEAAYYRGRENPAMGAGLQ